MLEAYIKVHGNFIYILNLLLPDLKKIVPWARVSFTGCVIQIFHVH